VSEPNGQSGEVGQERPGRGDAAPVRLSRRQQLLAEAVGATLVTLLALLAAELVLRICHRPVEYSWYPRYALVPDPWTGARYAPNLRLWLTYEDTNRRYRFTTNSMGFRSRELPWTKRPGAFRILFIGDSFTEGFGVNDEETMPHYFEAIARTMDKRIEVINAGQTATDIPEYAGLARGYVNRLRPDLVIVNFYAGNDVPIEGPPGPPPRFKMSYGIRVSPPYENRVRTFSADRWIFVRHPEGRGARLDRWLHRHSLLYRLASEQLLRLRPVRALFERLGWIEERPPKPPVVFGRAVAQSFLKEPQEDVEAKLRESLEYLRQIKRTCNGAGARLFVQIIPHPFGLKRFRALWNYVSPKWRDVWEKRLGRPARPEDIDKDRMNQLVRRVVEQADVEFLDLARLAHAAERYDEFYQLTYGASVGHFSPDDNLYDALVLMKALIDKRLLPPTITTEGLVRIWREKYSRIPLPFVPPPAPAVPGGRAVAKGFGRAVVRSSFARFEGEARKYVGEGFFTPVFNAEPEREKAKQGDFIALEYPLPAPTSGTQLAVAVEICRPATDPRADKAVRRSVGWAGRDLWSSLVGADLQGRWEPLALPLGGSDGGSTLSIRVEAVRDFDRGPTGEYPLLLRLRRLRIYEVPARSGRAGD